MQEEVLASGEEEYWLRLADLKTDLDGGQILDGNVTKSVLVDPNGLRYFTKRYHPRLAPRDAIYEFIGQRVFARMGVPSAKTYLGEESLLYICSRDFLGDGERLLTLRSLKIEAKRAFEIVEFYEKNLNARSHAVEILLVDAVLNNRGRHTGNLGVITDAAGHYIRPAPIFDTVSFDNTRLFEVAKLGRKRWLSPGANPDLSHAELVQQLDPYISPEERRIVVARAQRQAERTIDEVASLGLLNVEEKALMRELVALAGVHLGE